MFLRHGVNSCLHQTTHAFLLRELKDAEAALAEDSSEATLAGLGYPGAVAKPDARGPDRGIW